MEQHTPMYETFKYEVEGTRIRCGCGQIFIGNDRTPGEAFTRWSEHYLGVRCDRLEAKLENLKS